jgi:hypothetical protein
MQPQRLRCNETVSEASRTSEGLSPPAIDLFNEKPNF